MYTTAHIDHDALDRLAHQIADTTAEELRDSLRKEVAAALRRPPVTLTVCDPLNDNATTQIVEMINKREVAALYALVHFAAHNLRTQTDAIQTHLEDRFQVAHLVRLPRADFLHAVQYLMETAEVGAAPPLS